MPIASSQEELLAKVQRWQEEPPTEEEKIEFLRTAIEDMKDPVHINEFKDNIKTLGIAAVKTDESFDKVNRTLKKFVKDYGSDFPEVATFQQRWEGYQNVHLCFSRLFSSFYYCVRIGAVFFSSHATSLTKRASVMGVRYELHPNTLVADQNNAQDTIVSFSSW